MNFLQRLLRDLLIGWPEPPPVLLPRPRHDPEMDNFVYKGHQGSPSEGLKSGKPGGIKPWWNW